jgi:hypothetical protein
LVVDFDRPPGRPRLPAQSADWLWFVLMWINSKTADAPEVICSLAYSAAIALFGGRVFCERSRCCPLAALLP